MLAYSRLGKGYGNFINQQTMTWTELQPGPVSKGVNQNFRKHKNISTLEFVDYYESYKETSLQLNETRKDVFWAMEKFYNTVQNEKTIQLLKQMDISRILHFFKVQYYS